MPTEKHPLVSVILTNYNGERFISQAIESVLQQTYPHWELIIIDDFSSDSSLSVIRQFTDSRISLHRNTQNEQIAKTHSIGNRLARGKYLAILDNDDIWKPGKLETQVSFMEAHAEIGACFSWPDFMDENGTLYDDPELANLYHVHNKPRQEWIFELLTTGNRLANDSVLVRREILNEIGSENISLTQLHDYYLWLQLILKHEIHMFEIPLMSYRKFSDSNSNSSQSAEKQRRLFFEYSWIIGNTITQMEPALFYEVFSDVLVHPELRTDPAVLCEKAILLSKDLFPCNCKLFSFALFSQLLQQEETAQWLDDHYSITQHDIYHLTGEAIFHDRTTQEEISQLKASNHALAQQLDQTYRQYQIASQDFLALQQSFFWRSTAPARFISSKLRNLPARQKLSRCWTFGKTTLRSGLNAAKQEDRIRQYEKTISQLYGDVSILPFDSWKSQRDHAFPHPIKFSILVPLYNTPANYLNEMISSVLCQSYANWELCIADGSEAGHHDLQRICTTFSRRDPRIKYLRLEKNNGISENTNACLKMATGDYYALLDHDDVLSPSALFEYAKAISEHHADVLYSDEAVFSDRPLSAFAFHYKPDIAPDTLRSYNYICHFLSFSKKLMDDSETVFLSAYDGSQDYDLILRLSEKAEHILHIPRVLYYWRSHAESVAGHIGVKPYAAAAAKAALSAHLDRLGLPATVMDSSIPSTYRIQYRIQGNPLVSIIIPNKDHVSDLRRCISSILDRSTYSNYEIIIVDNHSQTESIQQYYQELNGLSSVRIVHWDHPFNFAQICNHGAGEARGEYLLLLNNDTQVITPSWIEEMLMFAQRQDVGAVGAMLYYPNDTVQHAGVVLHPEHVAFHYQKNLSRGETGYEYRLSIAQNFSAVTGACLLTRKELWEEVQGMDESLAVSYNDIDYCLKLREKGYLIVWTPYAELYHYESQSRGTDDTMKKQALTRHEMELMHQKWSSVLGRCDPYYNPNLTP